MNFVAQILNRLIAKEFSRLGLRSANGSNRFPFSVLDSRVCESHSHYGEQRNHLGIASPNRHSSKPVYGSAILPREFFDAMNRVFETRSFLTYNESMICRFGGFRQRWLLRQENRLRKDPAPNLEFKPGGAGRELNADSGVTSIAGLCAPLETTFPCDEASRIGDAVCHMDIQNMKRIKNEKRDANQYIARRRNSDCDC